MQLTIQRMRQLAALAVPIVASMFAINLMGLVDTAMVGQLGASALGAVGFGGQIFALFVALLSGFGAAVQVLVARRIGEGRAMESVSILKRGMATTAGLGLTLVPLGVMSIPILFSLLSQDPLVKSEGCLYLDARLPSLVFVGCNLIFRGYWIGTGNSKWAMASILVAVSSNVVFNYLLIFGKLGFPVMGVEGAGIGTTLATFMGLIANSFLYARSTSRKDAAQAPDANPKPYSILHIAAPESVRQLLFAFGVVALYFLVGRMGTEEVAVFHVCLSLMLVCFIPAQGMGQAATTLVSRSIGSRDLAEAKRWGWEVATAGAVVLGSIVLLLVTIPELFVRLFITDAALVPAAIIPLRIGVIGFLINSVPCILNFALIGAGAARQTMVIEVSRQWFLFLPLVGVAIWLDFGLEGVFTALCLDSALGLVAISAIWYRGSWSIQHT